MKTSITLSSALILGAAAWLLAPAPAHAQDAEDEEEEGGGDDGETVVVDEDKPKPKPKQEEFKKQDLRGHAVDGSSASNVFEKDRFFVDKVDTAKTEKGTLIQGSIASSSFIYNESSGKLDPVLDLGTSGSRFRRLFTELRLQTDFRHIAGGKWDARIDTRARVVNGGTVQPTRGNTGRTDDLDIPIQSGFNGKNEYEVREAWIVRSGKRSDLFFGRQFITDLGALRIDGLRVDYAQSEKLTLIGFGGLYPVRGSRSITTDYPVLKDTGGNPAGRIVVSGGAGAAYRTLNTHGALGVVTIAPLKAETPRVYATANGYYRAGKIDLYHLAILDAFGEAAPALTNLSAGANYKPSQRLRVSASFNRVDTETLNVQANAFLNEPDPTVAGTQGAGTRIQNETFLSRLATNAGRLGVSASLGKAQRFEVSTSANYRFRSEIELLTGNNTAVTLPAAKGVDIYLGLLDRHSFAKLRLGADVTRSFAVGNVSFHRSTMLAARLFAARELKGGRGEWEAEVGYSTTRDVAGGTTCDLTNPAQCFGTSNGTIFSLGGNVYYRINRNLFALGNLFVSRTSITPAPPMGMAAKSDPAILGLTGFARIAYRF